VHCFWFLACLAPIAKAFAKESFRYAPKIEATPDRAALGRMCR
jgi:hypothetical protein